MKETLQKLIPVLQEYFEKAGGDIYQFEIANVLTDFLWGDGLESKIDLPFDIFDLTNSNSDGNFWIEARTWIDKGEDFRGSVVIESDVYFGEDTEEVLESLAALWIEAERVKKVLT